VLWETYFSQWSVGMDFHEYQQCDCRCHLLIFYRKE
jgi:hypothetical protein